MPAAIANATARANAGLLKPQYAMEIRLVAEKKCHSGHFLGVSQKDDF
jgi:hypothetical protein